MAEVVRMKSGIHTFDDLMLRCVVDEITGHWHYKGGFTRNAKTGGCTPTIWYPPLQRTVSVAKAVGLIKGSRLAKGCLWYRACGCYDCANPEHHRVGTRSEMTRLARRDGNTALHNALISAARRRQCGISAPAFAVGSSVFNLLPTTTPPI
jgi:hypothetical protein